MTTALLVLAFLAFAVSFFAAGVLVAEWRQRRESLLKLAAFDAEWKASAAKIADVHNQLAEKVAGLTDQVSGLEFRLAGKAR